MKCTWEKWQHGTEWLWRSFTECKRKRKEGFKPKQFPLVEGWMKGCQECFSGQAGFAFFEESDSFLQSLCKAERQNRTDKIWDKTLCQLLRAVLKRGDGRLLSGMALCAKTERSYSRQLEKGTISLSQAQNGEVIALLSFLGPRKISSKLCPEWRARTPSRQLEAVLKDSQLSPCAAQPQQCNAAKPPSCPLDCSSFQAFLKEAAVQLRNCSFRAIPRLARADRSMKQKPQSQPGYTPCAHCAEQFQRWHQPELKRAQN